MKKNLIKILLTIIISFSPVYLIFASSTWSYTVSYKTNDIVTTSEEFSSLEACNADRTTYMNSSEYKKNPNVYNVPGVCTETKTKDDAVSVTPKIGTSESKSIYTLLAPIGKITTMNSTTGGCADTDETCIGNNIGKYLNYIFKFIIGLCAALAVVMLIINGITYMGDESIFTKVESKKKMLGAISGLIIALGAWTLLNTINPDLTGSKGVSIDTVNITISKEDTSTGSSTSLCISTTNPPNPSSATGTSIILNDAMKTKYLPAIETLNLPTGLKLLMTAQTYFEGFYDGSKSYRTNNPGNIGNTDDGSTKTFPTLVEGIKKQQTIITNVANNSSTSYKTGGKSTCALGSETYSGYLYQYLRIYATGPRSNNNYLNAIIGYFKANGKTITAKTTISEIYNMK